MTQVERDTRIDGMALEALRAGRAKAHGGTR